MAAPIALLIALVNGSICWGQPGEDELTTGRVTGVLAGRESVFLALSKSELGEQPVANASKAMVMALWSRRRSLDIAQVQVSQTAILDSLSSAPLSRACLS